MPAIAGPFADKDLYGTGWIFLLSILLVPMQSLPLWWRRSHSVAVWITVVIVVAIKVVFGLSLNASSVAVIFAIYALSVYGPAGHRLWPAAAAIAMILVSVVAFYSGRTILRYGDLFAFGPPMLVAWVIGDYIRSRRDHLAAIVAQHEADREHAAEEQRLRIARELHDVVAHNVSLMAIQAGAARIAGRSNGEALESIERSARDTLGELNKLVGILRKRPDSPDLAPQPGVDDIEALLDSARDAGLDVKWTITGNRRQLPAALNLSAYRIVQEALTNVLKHAQASRVEVTMSYEPDAVSLTIIDNGSGAQRPVVATATGHGLIGMHERVQMLGGELTADSSLLGGFTVRARLPLP